MGKITGFVMFLLQFNLVLCDTENIFGEDDLKTVIGIQNLLCDGTRLCGIHQPVNYTYYERQIILEIPKYIDGSCCGECSCDVHSCLPSATCCPDTFDHVPTIRESSERTKTTCEYAQLLENSLPRQRPQHLPMMMTRKCLDDFLVKYAEDANTKDKCENPINYDLIETKIPVTDLQTLKTYANIYCLKCSNGTESHIQQWDVFVECRNFGDEADLFNKHKGNIVKAVKASRGCNLIYKKPEDKFPELKGLFGCKYVIKECNVTGYWEVYDPLIEAACHSYISVFDGKYNNIFCALCNAHFVMGICQTIQPNIIFPSFSALLKFSGNSAAEATEPTDVDKMCSENQVFDEWKNKCRNLSCRFPKEIQKGKCINSVGSITGAAYRIYLKLSPDKLLSLADLFEITVMLDDYVKTILRKLGMTNMVYYYNAYYKKGLLLNDTRPSIDDRHNSTNSSYENSTTTIPLPIPSPPWSNPTDSVDHPENSSIGNEDGSFTVEGPEISTQTPLFSIEYFLFYIRIYFAPLFENKTVDILDEVLGYDGHTELLNSSLSKYSAVFKLSIEDFGHDGVESNPELNDTNDSKTLESTYVPYDYFDFNTGLSFARLGFEPSVVVPGVLAEKSRCPLIEIEHKEFSVEYKWNELFIRELNLTVPLNYLFKTNETDEGVKYLICADFYINRISQIVGTNETYINESNATPQAILSIVCISLSLLCNLMTLITYSLFKELRSQPGINNICLVICLAIAQCLFQFGLMVSKHLGSQLCITLGISIHFFWLMVMFWMNVCSFHMFKVFGNSFQIKSHSGKCRTTTVYLTYSVLASVLFIAINIIESSVTSDNVDIGYSSETCYISRPAMVGFVFALPVGIVILINLVLFVIVIASVCRNPTLNSENDISRNYLKIYAKLSTITGITWIFGFIFFFTDVTFLEYLFIIFNASQGVFLCFAFVLNKRVWKLYTKKYGSHKPKDSNESCTMKTSRSRL